MILNGTGDTLQAFMSGAAATTNPAFFISYGDIADSDEGLTADSAGGALNGTTDVELVAGVASSRRAIKNLSICNVDTAPVDVTVQFNDGTDRVIVDAMSIPTGKTLYWSMETGWVLQPDDSLTLSTGTFTPVADFATTGDWAPTYDTQEGRFTVLGDLVFYEVHVKFDANAHTTAAGNFRITGLPFTVVTDAQFGGAMSIGTYAIIDLDADCIQLVGFLTDATTRIEIYQTRDANSLAILDIANFPASTNDFLIRISGWYQKA